MNLARAANSGLGGSDTSISAAALPPRRRYRRCLCIAPAGLLAARAWRSRPFRGACFLRAHRSFFGGASAGPLPRLNVVRGRDRPEWVGTPRRARATQGTKRSVGLSDTQTGPSAAHLASLRAGVGVGVSPEYGRCRRVVLCAGLVMGQEGCDIRQKSCRQHASWLLQRPNRQTIVATPEPRNSSWADLLTLP